RHQKRQSQWQLSLCCHPFRRWVHPLQEIGPVGRPWEGSSPEIPLSLHFTLSLRGWRKGAMKVTWVTRSARSPAFVLRIVSGQRAKLLAAHVPLLRLDYLFSSRQLVEIRGARHLPPVKKSKLAPRVRLPWMGNPCWLWS